MKRFAWLGLLSGLLFGGAVQAAPLGPVQYSALPNCPTGALQYTLSTATIACGSLPNIGTALPSATTSQLYGGTGAAGAASAVTVGSGLSLSGATLTSTVNLSAALPSATTSQLYGGTGAAGTAQAITLGTGLSMSGTTLNATGGGGGVTQIIAGTNVTVSPIGGTGAVTVSASGGGGSGGGSSLLAMPVTTGTGSASAFAFKGAWFLPTQSSVTLTGLMAYLNTTVSGGEYEAIIANVNTSNNTINSIVAISNVYTTSSVFTGSIMLQFSSPITLVAGTTYAVAVGAINQGSTYALPVSFPTGTIITTLPFILQQGEFRLAQTTPAAGQTFDNNAGSFGVPSIGLVGYINSNTN